MSEPVQRASVEHAVDAVFDLLIEDAGYLAPPDETEMRYAPTVSLLEALAWNIVIAFWVNVAASFFYDHFMRRAPSKTVQEKRQLEQEVVRLKKVLSSTRQKLATKEDLIQTLEETNQLLKSLKASAIIIQSIHVDSSRIAELLESWGWPRSEAKIKAEALIKEIRRDEGENIE